MLAHSHGYLVASNTMQGLNSNVTGTKISQKVLDIVTTVCHSHKTQLVILSYDMFKPDIYMVYDRYILGVYQVYIYII